VINEFHKQRFRGSRHISSKKKSNEVSLSLPSAATGVFSFKPNINNSLTRKSFSPIMESSGNQSPMITDSYNLKNLSTIGGDISEIRKKTPLGVSQYIYQTIPNKLNDSNYNEETFEGESF
jgi:hypothetical protein